MVVQGGEDVSPLSRFEPRTRRDPPSVQVKQSFQQEKHPRTYEDEKGHLHRGFLIYFGHQIRCGDVDRHARRQRQPRTHMMSKYQPS